MRIIPFALLAQFEVILREEAVPNNAHGSCKKRLCYYLDFCQKYHFSESKRESLAQFFRKLEEKRQTKAQRQEASYAITLYYELIDAMGSHDELGSPQKVIPAGKVPDEPPPLSAPSSKQVASRRQTAYQWQTSKEPPLASLPPAPTRKVTAGVSWKVEYAKLAQAIQVRHYSPKTLKTSAQWVRHY